MEINNSDLLTEARRIQYLYPYLNKKEAITMAKGIISRCEGTGVKLTGFKTISKVAHDKKRINKHMNTYTKDGK